MKFLFDTNVLIPLEPGSTTDIEEGTLEAARLYRLISESHCQVYLHPAVLDDIRRDKNTERRALREALVAKYPLLMGPPRLSTRVEQMVGKVAPETHDWVDHLLLSSLEANAVDFLVTEDVQLRKKAARLDLAARTLTIPDAITVVQNLFPKEVAPPPAVEKVMAYALDPADPIFDSLEADYEGFDAWLAKCQREHRPAWIIRGAKSELAAVTIVKPEDTAEFSGPAKILKICTFKVSENSIGLKFGELLLKSVLTYADRNGFEWLYVEIMEKHGPLIHLLGDFGFEEASYKTRRGELVLAKPLCPSSEDMAKLSALDFNTRYGPFAARIKGEPTFVVPILPRYHERLFPELEKQQILFQGQEACGNSIRKAYLSQSSIRKIEPGANLLFYRSEDAQHVTATGVVDGILVASSPDDVARYVGARTVYSYSEISELCEEGNKEVLSILFRQARTPKVPLTLQELQEHGVLTAPPRSIVTVRTEATTWLQTRLHE